MMESDNGASNGESKLSFEAKKIWDEHWSIKNNNDKYFFQSGVFPSLIKAIGNPEILIISRSLRDRFVHKIIILKREGTYGR